MMLAILSGLMAVHKVFSRGRSLNLTVIRPNSHAFEPSLREKHLE